MYTIEDLQKKSQKELLELVSELKGKLLALRFENSTGQLNETHLFQSTRRDIARIFTVLNAMKNGTTTLKTETPTTKKETKAKEVKEEAKVEEVKTETTVEETKPEVAEEVKEGNK